MSHPLFLGIDLGSSGCRVCVIDAHRKIIAAEKEPLKKDSAQSPRQSIEAWHHAVRTALKKTAAQTDLTELQGIAFDTTSGTVFLTTRQGEPVSDILYYDDQRASREAYTIKDSLIKNAAARYCTSSLAKFLWLIRHQRPQCDFLFMHQADWLLHILSGRKNILDENNALKLGYDSQKQRWPAWLPRLLSEHAHCLPDVVPPGTLIGNISPLLARETGINPAALIYAGTTDSIAAVMASGINQPGEAVTSLGSTMVLKAISQQPVHNEQYGIYSHKFGDFWLAGGASNSGGAALLQFFSKQDMENLARQINPDVPSGYTYYPLPTSGERFPVNDPEKRSITTPRPDSDVQFFHGLLEGIAHIEEQGYLLLEQSGCPAITHVYTAGGGAHNLVWQKIRQRISARRITQARQTEAAYGCALLARNAACKTPNRSSPPSPESA